MSNFGASCEKVVTMRDAVARAAGPTIFCRQLAKRRCIEHRVGQQPLRLGLGHVHAAVLGLPVVKRPRRYGVLARQVGGLGPRLVLPQNPITCSSSAAVGIR